MSAAKITLPMRENKCGASMERESCGAMRHTPGKRIVRGIVLAMERFAIDRRGRVGSCRRWYQGVTRFHPTKVALF
jgi:hypothetical protein